VLLPKTSNLLDDASLTLAQGVGRAAQVSDLPTRSLPTSSDILGAEKIQNQVVTITGNLSGKCRGIHADPV